VRTELAFGKHILELDMPERQLVGSQRGEASVPVADLFAAVSQALEKPFHYPALRRAMTPDDHVAIAIDEQLQEPARFLVPILEHVQQAGVSCQAITLLCQPPSTGQPWLEDLPDEYQDVHLEVHDPSDRRRLSYLATTRAGRRIYLNRTAVDADQLVLLTRRSYDCRMGYAGGEGGLFPALSDEAARKEAAAKLSFSAPGAQPWPAQELATEVVWLLGAPFFVQVIEGRDGEIAGVLGGSIDSSPEGQRLLDARWRIEVDEPADVVVATISGDPARTDFTDLARALACAVRVVKPNGKVVLLTDAAPTLGRSAEIMRITEDPGETLRILAQEKPADEEAGFLWCRAAQNAKLYLLSRLPTETAEELFVTPLENARQALRVIGAESTYVVLPDAHKSMAVLRKS
jgi:nickel-dependent lactate racemase